jgi:hypothetical protein
MGSRRTRLIQSAQRKSPDMQTRGLVDLSEEGVLGEESSEFGIEVAGLGVVEAGLGVVDVSGEGEAVGARRQLLWEAEVAPGILGPDSGAADRYFTPETPPRPRRRRLRWGRRAPLVAKEPPFRAGSFSDREILLPAAAVSGPAYFGSLRYSIG